MFLDGGGKGTRRDGRSTIEREFSPYLLLHSSTLSMATSFLPLVIFHHLFIRYSFTDMSGLMGYTTDGRWDSLCPVRGNSSAGGSEDEMRKFPLGPGWVRTSAPLYVLIG